jgi:hypothetical protein
MKNLEKKKKEMAEKMLGLQKGSENKKYGEFILQTNKVQYKLNTAIMLNSVCLDKKYCDQLLGLTMGSLITVAQACISFSEEDLEMLRKYVEARNKLSHKMFTLKHLNVSECTKALESGEKIIIKLDKLIEVKISK